MKYIQPLKQFFATDLGVALILAITWQIMFTFAGSLFDLSLNGSFQRQGIEGTSTFLGHTMLWDAGWYTNILHGSYFDPNSASSVFYPLFPLLIAILNTLTFGLIGTATLGLLLNTALLGFAIYFLRKISCHFLPSRFAWWPVALFLTSPVAIFMHMFYTEALFCMLAFGAYYFALERKWVFMGILLALLTGSRLPSILFVGLCAIEFIRAYDWNIKKVFNKNILVFLIAPLGFILYGLFMLVVRGDFLGMFAGYHLSNDWPYHSFNPNVFELYYNTAVTLYHIFITGTVVFDEGQVVNALMPAIGFITLFVTSLYLIFTKTLKKHIGIPLGIFGIVTIVFLSLNSNLISVNRYLLPCFGIYLVISMLLARLKIGKKALYVLCYGGVLLQAYLLVLFVNGWFAG